MFVFDVMYEYTSKKQLIGCFNYLISTKMSAKWLMYISILRSWNQVLRQLIFAIVLWDNYLHSKAWRKNYENE